jgi:hypothetical protein
VFGLVDQLVDFDKVIGKKIAVCSISFVSSVSSRPDSALCPRPPQAKGTHTSSRNECTHSPSTNAKLSSPSKNSFICCFRFRQTVDPLIPSFSLPTTTNQEEEEEDLVIVKVLAIQPTSRRRSPTAKSAAALLFRTGAVSP